MEVKTNPYLAIAEAELNLALTQEDNEKTVEIVKANKDEIVRLICDEIQANERIQELIREDVLEAIREYVETSYRAKYIKSRSV